jgi:hypothetical protein
MEGTTMKKTFLTAGLALLLATAPAMAQIMDPAGHMARQQEQMMQKAPEQHQPPSQATPHMMGGYGYNMGPHMMPSYGYAMGPHMMGGYGYNMGPQMMPPYGYAMGPHMMPSYGYTMGPPMMGEHGLGMHHMMGGWGHHPIHQMMGGWNVPPCTGVQGPYKTSEEYTKFLDATKEERKRMHGLMFDYGEAMRGPEPDREKLQAMETEINELREKIFTAKKK